MESLNLSIATIVTIMYFVMAIKLLSIFLKSFTEPMNQATGTLLIGALIGFGINLQDFSEIAVSSFFYYSKQNNIFIAIAFWLLFALIAFVFSYVLFRFSFFVINWSTPENEKAELGKNNLVLAFTHATVYVLLCLVLSSPLTILANTLVSYSEFPN